LLTNCKNDFSVLFISVTGNRFFFLPHIFEYMRQLLFFPFILLFFSAIGQTDTVVVQYDSTFTSLLSRRLNDKRTAVKYTMEERGNIRDVRVYLSSLEEMVSGRKMYGIRIDTRGNRNLFTDAPLIQAEYIDEDEIPVFIERLEFISNKIQTDADAERYTEYRFYTRGGIALECYTGLNRWRVVIMYEMNKEMVYTYLNNEGRLNDLLVLLKEIEKEIKVRRSVK